MFTVELSSEERRQQIEWRDPFSIFILGKMHLQCWVWFSAPHYETNKNTVEWVQQQAMKMISWHTRRDWDSWDCLTWRRKGSGCSYPRVQIPDEENKDNKARSRSVMPRDTTRGNWAQSEIQNISLDVRKFLQWWWLNTGTNRRKRLWRYLKTQLDTVLSNMLLQTLPAERGWAWWLPELPLHSPPSRDSVCIKVKNHHPPWCQVGKEV